MKRNVLNRTSTNKAAEISGQPQCRRSGSLLLGFVLALIAAGPAVAGPTGAEIVSGEGVVTYGTGLTRIDQASGRISINWDSFNVATNETVRFVQPSTSSVALNTIFDQNPSQIFGTIDANGRVLLINPNGMIFGATAQVNVAGLVASSLNISTADFMAGEYTFESAGGSGGLILNQGSLHAAPGGFIALLGEAVANEGLIVADAGTIAMGSGTKAALDFDGSGLLYFEVESEVLDNALGLESGASNTGSLFADGGQVLLTAEAAQDVFTNAINNEGLIRARRIDNTGGVVRLVGSGGNTIGSGVIDASAGDDRSTGGDVQILGDRVGLFGDAVVDASGATGGGTVKIGGGFQGNDAAVDNASRTFVGRDVSIAADAGTTGDGGEVIVWSDEVTRFYGSISATGGANRGDGGFAEVSGKQHLDFEGNVVTSAANGATGTLLLDPASIFIIDGADLAGDQDANVVNPAPQLAFGDADTAENTVSVGRLQALGDTNIELQATDTITVGDSIGGAATVDLSASLTNGANTLTLSAGNGSGGAGDVTFNTGSSITTGGGGVTINAGQAGDTSGNADLGVINTAGGDVTINAIGDVVIAADVNSSGGTVNVTADDSVTIAAGATVTSGAGNVSVRVDNADDSTDTLAVQGNISSSGTVALTGSATDANDVLQGSDNGDTWVTDGANTGTFNGWDFDDFATLQGGAGADSFAMGTADFTGAVGGGDGDDQFNVNVNQSGQLNGGEGSDTFAIANGVTFTFAGTAIDGGVDAAGDDVDTLDVSANVAALNVILTGSTANEGFAGTEATMLTGVGGQFDGIDALAASNNFGNTLTGRDVDSTWTYSSYSDGIATLDLSGSGEGTAIGGAGTNTLEGDDGGVDTADLFITDGFGFVTLFDQDFVNIDILNGLNGNDTFNLTTSDFGGTVIGGAGNDQFNVDVSQTGSLDGGAGDDTLNLNAAINSTVNGGDGDDQFNVNANQSGQLNGGEGSDTFTLADGVALSFAGTAIDGGADAAGDDTDTLNVQAYTGALDVVLTGSTANEGFAGTEATVLTGVGGQFDGIDAIDTSLNSGNRLTGLNVDSTWTTGSYSDGTATLIVTGEGTLIAGTSGTQTLLGDAGGVDTDDAFITDGLGLATLNGRNFQNIDVLNGLNGADTFDLTTTDFGGTVIGGDGDDQFNVNVSQSGQLNGGEGSDTFTLADGVALSFAGTAIDGGADAAGDDTDTLNVQAYTGALDVVLTGSTANSGFAATEATVFAGAGGGFDGIDTIDASLNFGNRLTGLDVDSTWTTGSYSDGTATLTFTGEGTLIAGTSGTQTLLGDAGGVDTDDVFITDGPGFVTLNDQDFVNIDVLNGLNGNDTFDLTTTDFGGTVSGGDGNDQFNVIASQTGSLDGGAGDDTFNLNSAVSGTVDGGDDSDTIVGTAAANTFVVNAANAGTVDGTAFVNVENLTGGAANDTFTFTAALTGTASGLGGDDVFNLNEGGSAGTINGGAGSDIVTYAARVSGAIVDLAGLDAIESIIGSNFDDTFNLNGDEDNDIDIDGAAGNDVFTVLSTSQITGDLDVANVEEVQIDADVTADNIAFSVSGAIIGTGGVFAQSLTTGSIGGQSITGSVGTFTASNAGGGDISLSNNGDLIVTSISQAGGGAVSIDTASNMDQAGAVTSDGGSISVSASGGSITMAAGTITNSNGGDIDYLTNGAGDITLGTLQACSDCNAVGATGNITISAAGNILGQVGQTHVTAVSAGLTAGGSIGGSITPIVFRNMPASGTPIDLEFTGEADIDSGGAGFTASELSSVSDVFAGTRETAASAQAAALVGEEEVDWAAYSEDITVYEINNEGVQLPEEEEADDFVRIDNEAIEDEGVNIPIARNDTN